MIIKRLKDKSIYHNWFAWRPVKIEAEKSLVWLETVERRKCRWDGGSYWEYKRLGTIREEEKL